MRRLFALLLPALFLGAAVHAGSPVFHYDSDIGVASDASGTLCLAINHRNLAVGHRVKLVVVVPEQSIAEAVVVRPIPGGCQGPEPSAPQLAAYELRVTSGTLTPSAPAIAVVDSAQPLRMSGDAAVADLEGNHQVEYFRACTSSEGVHLSVWTGKPLTGKRRWHEYYYLGYDVEPTCTDQDVPDKHP